jgi:hypothetical protein
MTGTHSRRTVLVALATGAAGAVAGCPDGRARDESTTVDRPATDDGSDGENGEIGETTGESGTDRSVDETATPALDLREANVVGVEFEGEDGTYRFDVTLYHDDDGEDGYANWWQVESLTGDRLGRRTLLHAHSTAPFTRSETIDLPTGTTCVVVRGHDQTHGYGGQAMVVNVDTGATARVQQGPERQSVSESNCP